ncbi:Phosphopantothenoylcysteine decarboxylase [Sesamum angolense]|uniref:Phosphopantothenoylcysteine decarboxylase n=1 Tax=Sesamum angolense TaxID=2727404 RepID=A0AAE1W0B0_9LAMI|nr:Phosphopantothenoylcysteine decarboxylase [Sesamum angolense]
MFVAPAMNTFMWTNPFTERHLMVIDDLGISLIPPVTKRLACGDYGNGAMAEPSLIYSTVVELVMRIYAALVLLHLSHAKVSNHAVKLEESNPVDKKGRGDISMESFV